MLRVILLGNILPPIGGISIHIDRLNSYLLSKGYITELMDDTGFKEESEANLGKNWILKFVKKNDYDLLHMHSQNLFFRFWGTIIAKLKMKKVVLSMHSYRERYTTKLDNIMWKSVLKFTDRIIVANEDIKIRLIKEGVKKDKVKVIPEFIPKEDAITTNIYDIDKTKDIIICISVTNLVFYNGEEIYGFDLAIDALNILKRKIPRLKLKVCMPNNNNSEYYDLLIEKIVKFGLENNIDIKTGNISFWDELKESNIFLRPTNTDGDAVSLREALYLGVPSIASDIVDRPNGCILFKNRDAKDLANRILDTIDNYSKVLNEINNIDKINYAKIIEELYLEIGEDV